MRAGPGSALRQVADLVAVALVVPVMGVLTLLGPGGWTPVSVGLGGVVLLCAPGYALVAALFPAVPGTDGDPEAGLALVERAVFAVAASVVLAMVVGIGLSGSPLSLTTGTVTVGLGGVTVACALVAAGRRRRRSNDADEAAPETPVSSIDGRRRRSLTIGLVLLGVVAIGWIGMLGLGGAGAGTAGFTEFALLTRNDSGEYVASGYPSQVGVNEARPLHLAIENHEGRQQTYTVGVFAQRPAGSDPTRMASSNRIDRFTTTVEAGESVRVRRALRVPITGEIRVEYRLYEGTPGELTQARPIERLHLWVTVTEARN
jgi:uncharacterized membrane protein